MENYFLFLNLSLFFFILFIKYKIYLLKNDEDLFHFYVNICKFELLFMLIPIVNFFIFWRVLKTWKKYI